MARMGIGATWDRAGRLQWRGRRAADRRRKPGVAPPRDEASREKSRSSRPEVDQNVYCPVTPMVRGRRV